MKKTAIVSCYFQHNYGSMLQAYATQMVLDKLGYENETIDISGFDGEIKKAKILYFIKASLTSDILITKIGRAKDAVVRKLKKNNYTRNVEARDEAFRRFKKEHFEMSPAYKSKKELSDNCSRYKAVLVGSDQLWLPGNIAADYYTLNFVPDEINTVAYATSFGQSSLPKDTTKLAKVFLSKIKHISVREESGARIVNNITGRTVPVVCDPTLLFDGKDWMIIQEEAPIIEGEYIFVYFLGNNLLHREFVTRLKKETNLKVVCLPHIDEYVEADEACSDIRLYDVDVDNNFCYAMLNAAIQYDVDLVMCGMYKDYGKTREKYTYYIPANVKFEKKDCIWLQEQLLHFNGNIATAYCKLINKKVLSTYNITHNENLRQGAEGLEFNIRLFEKIDSAVFIGEWLYHYIYNENSISAKHDEANHEYVLKCFRMIKNQVQESHNKTELMKWFDNRLLYVVITTAISGYFSPSNKEPFRCKCDKFRKYLKNDMVDTALRSNNTQGLSNERKVMLFCIKHNMFAALQVFAFLRNLQKKIK